MDFDIWGNRTYKSPQRRINLTRFFFTDPRVGYFRGWGIFVLSPTSDINKLYAQAWFRSPDCLHVDLHRKEDKVKIFFHKEVRKVINELILSRHEDFTCPFFSFHSSNFFFTIRLHFAYSPNQSHVTFIMVSHSKI